MTFIDFFAGVGGFRRGLELAGHHCVGFCEYDKFAVASYTAMHTASEEQLESLRCMDLKKRQKEILKDEYRNGEWYARDIRTVNVSDIPRADIWCFGFPCQDISIAGDQLGFRGNRSSLFFAVMQLVRSTPEEDRPSYLFIENVKNLLSINGGRDFAAVLYTLDECGYDAEWQVVNSKDYGVPQNRERVFIIGHFRGRGEQKVFPISGSAQKNSISLIGHRDGYHKNLQTYAPEGITETLDTAGGGGREHHVALEADPINKDWRHKIERVYINSAPTLLARDYKDATRVAVPINFEIKNPQIIDDFYKSRPARQYTDAAPTLRSSHADLKVAVDLDAQQGVSVIGGIGQKKSNNGQQWYQQDRIYNGEGIATSVAANLPGGANMYAVPAFAIDKNAHGEETDMARALIARYDAGVINHKGVSSAVAIPVNTGTDGTSRTAKASVQISDEVSGGIPVIWYEKRQCYIAIRKLTPKECWRLQGWTDDYFERARLVSSDSQLYKQAGNGVTVTVIQAIGEKLKDD